MEERKASIMVESIVDYIYEEGEGKITNCEVLGILEFVKLKFMSDFLEKDEI